MLFRRRSQPSIATPPMRIMDASDGAMHLTHMPTPTPKTHELLLKISYTGVNRADLLQVAGKYPPPAGDSPLPGLEVSGTIAAVGESVVGWSVGEQVCALLNGGGYAEYVTVPATQVLALPNALTLREAATLPEAAATAFMALRQEANVQPGERVLIHGGMSGVGVLMTQTARAWGAQVYATVGSDKKTAKLKKLGITPINHSTAPFSETVLALTEDEGVDVIIDTLGGPQLATHLQLLRSGGRLVSLAVLEGSTARSVKLSQILTKHLRIAGATLRNRSSAEKATIIEGVRKTIWPYVTTGVIKPIVDSSFPLEEAEKAHARMQERLHLGKILLEVAPES